MGLLLYAVLIFFGMRDMPFKRAVFFCLLTAALATILGVGGVSDLPGCGSLRCQQALPTLALTFLVTLAIAFACFGIGAAAGRLLAKSKG